MSTDRLQSLLSNECSKIVERPFLPGRLILLELTRAIDEAYFVATGPTPSEDSTAFAQLALNGWNKTLSLFVDSSTDDERPPIYDSTPGLQRWAQSVLARCGQVAKAENAIEAARIGLLSYEGQTDDLFSFRLADTRFGTEQLEVSDWIWLRNFARSIGGMGKAYAREKRIMRALEANVDVFRERYIRYDTTPELDDFFHENACAQTTYLEGPDSFADSATFGGVEFADLRSAVITLYGWALKHSAFAQTLFVKEGGRLPLQNLLTVTVADSNLVDWLSDALDISTEAASLAVSLVTLDARNAPALTSVSGGPPPPLLRIGNGWSVRSYAGSLCNPFCFLLRELRRRFPADWDRQIDPRENVFRSELFEILEKRNLVFVQGSVDLMRGNKRATDIDAVVYHPNSCTAGLFQLKWQEPFAGSLRERGSRMNNLISTAEKWLTAVQTWMNSSEPSALAADLQLSGREIKSVKLFILGRNFSQFSGTTGDDRAAWGNWAQLVRLVTETPLGASDPISLLHEALARESLGASVRWRQTSIRFPSFEVSIKGNGG